VPAGSGRTPTYNLSNLRTRVSDLPFDQRTQGAAIRVAGVRKLFRPWTNRDGARKHSYDTLNRLVGALNQLPKPLGIQELIRSGRIAISRETTRTAAPRCGAPRASPWHLPVRPCGGILSKRPRPGPGASRRVKELIFSEVAVALTAAGSCPSISVPMHEPQREHAQRPPMLSRALLIPSRQTRRFASFWMRRIL